VIVDCAVYEDGRRRKGRLALEDVYEECGRTGAFAWIGLLEPTEEEFDSVRREFQLHELAVEDAIKAHQRPKLETYGNSLFLVLKTARYLEDEETVEFGQIMLFIGSDFVVSVRHGEGTALHQVRLDMEDRPDLLGLGPGAVVYSIVDRVVDDYMPVLEGLDNDIREVESTVFSESRANPAERIYKLKREVLELHGAMAPLLEPLASLASRQTLVHGELRPYFRDIHDHLVRMVERVQGFRELLTNVLTANLTQASIRQNEDVRKISAWAAIIAVRTMIAGLYGMNFEHMPELEWTFGYPLVVAVILVICVALYRYFRRVGWL
jgi:magnesium transporter